MMRHRVSLVAVLIIATVACSRIASVDSVCDDHAARCNGDVAETCVDGAWVSQFDCSHYADDAGIATTCREFGAGPVCAPGAVDGAK